MELTEALNKVGLNEKQAKVYLALLELGTATAYAIAPKAELKRPITYIVLDDLKAKGLVSTTPTGRSVLYTAEEPGKLLAEQNKKTEILKRFLPNLEALYNERKEKPSVQLFEGLEGMRHVYEKIYSASEVQFFGSIEKLYKFNKKALEAFVEKTGQLKIPVKDLLSESAANLAYAKFAAKHTNYQIRFLAKDKQFLNDSAIFGGSVVFFSFHPQIFAVMITSREISQAIKTLFEFAWAAGEKYESVVK